MRRRTLPSLLLAACLFLLPVPLLAAEEVEGANVFSGYLESGDWLVTICYEVDNATYNMTRDSKSVRQWRLLSADYNTTYAQVPLQAWGYKPGSIYLSAASVAALEWGTNYTVSLHDTVNDAEVCNYTLEMADWRGTSMSQLDDWCIMMAYAMEAYYADTYVASTAVQGLVLNEEVMAAFVIGIPYLDEIRPGLFQVTTSTVTYTEDDHGDSYIAGLDDWSVAVGPYIAGMLNDSGGIVNLTGDQAGRVTLLGAYAALAAVAIPVGGGPAGLIFGLPLVFLGVYLRLVDVALLGVGIFVATFLWVWHFWWRST